MRALIVDDDNVCVRLLIHALGEAGFVTEPAESGEDAIDLVKVYDFDVVLLDLSLPDMETSAVIRRIRSLRHERGRVPILVLAGELSLELKVELRDLGADDFLTKPWYRDDLVASVRSLVRRSRNASHSVIQVGRLAIDMTTRFVYIDGVRLHVTGTEYNILELLALRYGGVVTKEAFLDHLYGGLDEPELKIIDVYICKIRKKIAAMTGGPHYIETSWGRGYTMRDPYRPEGVQQSSQMTATNGGHLPALYQPTQKDQQVTFRGISVCFATGTARVGGKIVSTDPHEIRALATAIQYKGRIQDIGVLQDTVFAGEEDKSTERLREVLTNISRKVFKIGGREDLLALQGAH